MGLYLFVISDKGEVMHRWGKPQRCILLLQYLGMESVIFDGKEYIKASVLAKRFSYTADYLGQLCRGKKVDARLVGRAWYINLDSLNQHRKGRYKTAETKHTEPVQTAVPTPRSHYLSRIDVEPILKKKTIALVHASKGSVATFPVKYEGDDYSLIPRVNKEAISVEIPVDPAEAEKVIIQKEKSPVTSFKAEALPEVYLKGRVKVAGLEEPTEDIVPEKPEIQPEIKPSRIETPAAPKRVLIQKIRRPVTPPPVTTSTQNKPVVLKIPQKTTTSPSQMRSIVPMVDTRSKAVLRQPVPHQQSRSVVTPTRTQTSPVKQLDVVRVEPKKPSFTPQSIAQQSQSRIPTQSEPVDSWRWVLGSVLLSLFLALLVLGLQLELFSNKITTDERVYFNFTELIEQLEGVF